MRKEITTLECLPA